MNETGYQDFDLRIERTGQGYRARVLSSPAGQALTDFALPFSDLELENFVLRMSRSRQATRRVGTPEFEAARTFGGRLFETVFAGEVRGCLRSSLDVVESAGQGLRLRLHLADAPELADLPWEYLYSPALNRFFALSTATPLVRYLDLPGRILPLAVQPPLRLLAIFASPRDYPSLDAEEEWKKLKGALKEVEEAGRLSVERLEAPTLSALQRRLRAGPCHVLHFMGHGAFDEAAQDGLLVLEDQNGAGRVISGQDLGVLLHDHAPMRLVVLNSCEGARTSRADPLAGTAQSLVQQGMPAVLAMQFEISDQAAIVLSHEFYAALAAGYPVDAALAEARKAIFTGASGAEWGTPVLYLRSADGRLFGVAPPPATPAAPVKQDAVPPATPAAPVKQDAVPPPAAPTAAPATLPRNRSKALLAAAAGALVVLAVAFGLWRLLSPGAGTRTAGAAATPAGTAKVAQTTQGARADLTRAPGTPEPSRAAPAEGAAPAASISELVARTPKVLTNSARVYDVFPAGDGLWAATSGGLVRWKADGANKVYSIVDGLPFNHLKAMLGRGENELWVASDKAVTRLDIGGDEVESIEPYTREDGIEFGESPSMMEDSDGSIWVASLYGEAPVLRFDGSLWRPPELPTDDSVLAGITPQISSMLRARDGAQWAGMLDHGILRRSDDTWTRFSEEQGVPRQQIWRMLEDSNGVLWAAAGEGGLLRFLPEEDRWERVEFQQADAPIYWISQLADDSLWASGNNFILRSEDGGQRWRTVASPGDGLIYPRAVVEDESGNIWAATNNGVALYADERWRTLVRRGEVSSEALGRLYLAPDGRLWAVPQWGGRASVIEPETATVTSPEGWPAESPDVVSLAFDGDTVWAGLDDGLIRVGGGEIERWDVTDGLPGPRINALLVVTDTLWIGGSEGLAKLDLESGEIVEQVEAVAGQYVDALTVAQDGAVWAGTHWGEDAKSAAVYRLAGNDVDSWSTGGAPLEREGAVVNAIAAAEDGAVWVASDTGVYRWDGARWQGWDSAQGAPAGEVFALLPQGGAMWMAGDGGTLDRWDAESGWERFEPEGMLSDALALRASGDGSFWIATQDGLLRYGPD